MSSRSCWQLMMGLGLIVSACSARNLAPRSPEAALKHYAAAIQAGDYARAYEAMSAEFRRHHSRDDFTRMLTQNAGEVRAAAERLQRATRPLQVEARLSYGDEESLSLLLEGGEWRIASDPLDYYSQRSPAEALRSFVRALEQHRYDVVLRFVPEKWAKQMTEAKLRQHWEGPKQHEVATLVRTLKANLKAPIQEKGDKASMPYAERFEVRFVREGGLWKIEDPD